MDRNREARRTSTISSSSNGLTRRRHRTSLRDSPEDGVLEMQDSRLRDRGSSGKKERERDRDRDRERDRERDRDRMNRNNNSSNSKRRRGDNRSMSIREGGVGDESSEESVNDDEEDEEDDGHLRIMQQQQGQGQGQQGQGTGNISQAPSLSASSLSNHNNSRRSFPLPAAAAATTTTAAANKVFSRPPWKDEMIGVSVPRKARSASTKRSHECWASSSSGGVHGGSAINNPNEQNFRQASTSPVRPSLGMSGSPVRPVSPSSSNASARKKLKPNGPKQRPPKSGPKTTISSMATSSSAQDEIEMEIAEVLYGLMRQPQPNSQSPQAQAAQSLKTETFESREENNNNNKDAKSRISSPVSNSAASASGGVVIGVQSSSILAQNSSSSVTPVSAIAPKRKKPRPVKYDDDNQSMLMARNSPISSTTKSEIDQATKIEAVSPNSDQPRTENGGPMPDAPAKSQTVSDSVKPEMNSGTSDVKPVVEELENRDAGSAKEEAASPRKESTSSVVRVDDGRVDTSIGVAPKVNPPVAENEILKEEIDLMRTPSRSSPERDGGDIDLTAANPKPMTNDAKPEVKSLVTDDEKSGKTIKEEAVVNADDLEVKAMTVDVETQKTVVHKEKSMDLHLDLEKNDTAAAASASVANNKQNQNQSQNQPVMKQHLQPQSLPDKTAQPTTTLPFPMSVASWPGGLPPMGYMAPLQGVVSMDGSTVAPPAIQPPQLIFSQPRPKRCATHCYIARNISYHQQFMRMNPFWPAAATSASLYGPKPCNLNVLPSTDLHCTTARGPGSMADKGQNLAIFSAQPGKDKVSPGSNSLDATQRKQILPQQALPAGAPSGIMPSAAFIFPLSQQAAAAATIRPASMKPPNAGNTASNTSSSASGSAAAAAAAATALSFNYPNIPGGETQYLAILQNNGYPFPVPAHVGAAPAYRGTHAQAMPFFNGPFYSSQMLHPSQQAPAPTQTQQQSHQNTSISSGSSSSHKQVQNQQPRPPHINGGNGSLQGFPTVKSPPSQQQSQHVPHQVRQLDSEIGGEDSPSTADSRVSRANMNIYGQSFPMAIHPPNFALMAPAQMAGAKGGASNPNEKKQQILSQQHGPKTGIESLPSQAFAMSFPSMNSSGSAPGLDMSSIAHSHAVLQSLPEATRQGYQMIASAAAAQSGQQKKNYRPSDEAKVGANEALNEDDRKLLAGKTPVIAFSRPDFADTAVSALPGSNVVDSSARTLNMGSAAPRASNSVMPGVVNNLSASASQQQLRNQQQQQQMIQITKQQQFAVTAAASAVRSKTPTSNGSVYTDHLSSSSAHSKYPNALASFPQNIVHSGSSQTPSPQWKNSPRTSTPQVPSPLTSTSSTHKNLPQAQGRNPPGQTQISFASNPKPSSAPPVQQLPNSNQSSSPPLVVGSPTNSSMSKSAGGSPRTTSSSTSNKPAQASSLSSQQGKSSPTVASRKSPPVVGGNVPSILGSAHMTTSSSGGTKHQLPQQQQINKQALQQNQLFFSHPYVQVQPPHTTNSTSAASVASGYYLQRRPSDQHQKSPQPQGTLTTSSSAMLSLVSASTCDPVKAVAASASNMKGAGVPSQGILHAAQFAVAQSSGSPHQIVPAGFPYVHAAVPNAVQVKTAEQKQPAA